MVDVSLKALVLHGDFGPFWLGSPRRELLEALGEPDGPIDATIWKFGDIEVMFDKENAIGLVNLHAFEGIPSGGKHLRLDPWILTAGAVLDECLHELVRLQIRFSCDQPEWDPGQFLVTVREKPHVHLQFLVGDDSDWPRGFHGIWMERVPTNIGDLKLRKGVTRD